MSNIFSFKGFIGIPSVYPLTGEAGQVWHCSSHRALTLGNSPKPSIIRHLCVCVFHLYPRLSKQIGVHMNTLQKLYRSLEALQAEVAVTRTERQVSQPIQATFQIPNLATFSFS